jgi:hypothetical protein
MALKLRSPAFGPGGEIPLKYTGDGADVSPPAALGRPARGDQEFRPHRGRPRAPDRNLGPLGALWNRPDGAGTP